LKNRNCSFSLFLLSYIWELAS